MKPSYCAIREMRNKILILFVFLAASQVLASTPAEPILGTIIGTVVNTIGNFFSNVAINVTGFVTGLVNVVSSAAVSVSFFLKF